MYKLTLILFVVTCICAVQYSHGWFSRSGTSSSSRSYSRSFSRSYSRSYSRGYSVRRGYRWGSPRRTITWQRTKSTVSRTWNKVKSSRAMKLWNKYGDYVKIGAKLVRGKYIGAGIIATEKVAKWYMKKYPNTQTTKLLQKAKNFHDRNKIIKYIYKGAKIVLKRDMEERKRMVKDEQVEDLNLYRNIRDENGNQNETVTEDGDIPCELVRYDIDKNGEVTVEEFKFFLSEKGLQGEKELVDKIDENDDGRITASEFQDFLDFVDRSTYVVDCE